MALKTVKKEIPDEKYKHKTENKIMEVYREQHPINPREEWDNMAEMMCVHNRLKLGDIQPSKSKYRSHAEMEEDIRENNDVAIIKPLYIYQHSGVTISTTPFNSRFDSSKVGFIYITEKKMDKMGLSEDKRDRESLNKILEAEVKTYDQYLNNEVWKYKLHKGEEAIDRCGGFYGDDREHIFETAGENLENYEQVETEI